MGLSPAPPPWAESRGLPAGAADAVGSEMGLFAGLQPARARKQQAMARFPRSRRLTCFYCGKRSGVRCDGAVRDFRCLFCDATNYLDEKGDITDPPVATDGEASAARFAAPRPSTRADSTFCPTCLKNQHLFTKSLAQYFPEDVSEAEYARLERNYYRYRKGLEKRYPQVCDACAGNVEARIRQAGYTAKTDHLRRMMDLSRGRRPAPSRTALDVANSLGRTVWRAGFVLQLLWHLTTIATIMRRRGHAMYDPDAAPSLNGLLRWLERATRVLPGPDALIQWSLVAAVASVWWNPHFVQFIRGFTRHLLGFTQWYSFQCLIVFLRLFLPSLFALQGGQGPSTHAQLTGHLVMVAVVVLIYAVAKRSIRVDMSPLFGTKAGKPSQSTGVTSPPEGKTESGKTLYELLGDALESVQETGQTPGQRRRSRSSAAPSMPTPASRTQATDDIPWLSRTHEPFALGTLRGQPVEYAEEMDWSPIMPRSRALHDAPGLGGDSSTTGHEAPRAGNAFWYKVPAAPVNPARRLRNPPQAPESRPKHVEAGQSVFGGGLRERTHPPVRGEAGGGVEFRQPQFFAPDRDDASSLADMLSQSFSLSQEQDDEGEKTEEETERRETGRTPGQSGGVRPRKKGGRGGALAWHAGLVESAIAGILLAVWGATLASRFAHQTECQMGVMVVAGLLALRGQGSASSGNGPQGHTAADYLLSAWAVVELAAACWIGCTLWERERAVRVGWQGSALLAMMLARLHGRRLALARAECA